MAIRLRVTGARLAFPQLFEATPYEEGGANRYSAVFLVKPDIKYVELDQQGAPAGRKISIEEAIIEAAKEKYQAKAAANLRAWAGNNNKMCYTAGDLKEYDGFAGHWALASHRKETQGPVTVVDANGAPLSPKSGKPYGGCFVTGSVDIYAQGGRDYPGMRCGLRGVRFERDGDAFGGGAPASPEEFGEVEVPEGAEEDLA